MLFSHVKTHFYISYLQTAWYLHFFTQISRQQNVLIINTYTFNYLCLQNLVDFVSQRLNLTQWLFAVFINRLLSFCLINFLV